MPGKTMIGGTAYDVKPGNVMVGGTVYTIKEGKTLINGTAYSIKFSSDVVVTITGSGIHGTKKMAYVVIDGTEYTSAATVIVPAGTEIYCVTRGFGGEVYLNGSSLGVSEYTFNAESDVSISLSASARGGKAEITTT